MKQRYLSGQVLAEAVVVLPVLVLLVLAIHVSSNQQYMWLQQWLTVQTSADAASAQHITPAPGVSQIAGALDRFRGKTMRDFQLGAQQWQRFQGQGQYAQVAWRLLGTGYASSDAAVVDQIRSAKASWQRASTASHASISPLLPSLNAIDAPWQRSGSPTDWLNHWRGSVPKQYLDPQSGTAK